MEVRHRINRSGLRKLAISLMFLGIFVTLKVKAGLLAPTLTVSPTSTNVQNGDTVIINIQSSVTVGVLSSITCDFSGGAFPTNASFTTSTSLLQLGGSVDATLTITNVSPASAGTYTITASTIGLLGSILSTKAPCTVSLIPTVTGVASNSAMIAKGFKVQFSGPVGSNLVIQASSDMQHWTPVYTNVMTGGTLTFTDAAARTFPNRFYKAKLK
jgi:hypothetical protein